MLMAVIICTARRNVIYNRSRDTLMVVAATIMVSLVITVVTRQYTYEKSLNYRMLSLLCD